MYKVQIVDTAECEVVKELSCATLAKARQTESGMRINLNHDAYHTRILDVDTGEEV